LAGCQWLPPVIVATEEAESRKIVVQSQPRQIGQETLFRKYPSQKRAGRVAEGLSPEFKSSTAKKKKEKKNVNLFHRSISRNMKKAALLTGVEL
jgi:hypothetical protein